MFDILKTFHHKWEWWNLRSNLGGALFFPLTVSSMHFSEGRTVTRFGLLSLNLLLILMEIIEKYN